MIHRIKIELLNGKIHEFRLGVGPCGKDVKELGVAQGNRLVVHQWYGDEPDSDEFHYPYQNILRFAVYYNPPAECEVPKVSKTSTTT